MVVRVVVATAVAAVVLITIASSIKAAEQHPAMTADIPPGWQLYRALPGEEFKPRGRFFDARTGCLLDLASDANGSPAGTRLICLRVERAGR